MGALATALGGKIAGELIRADDWNALIAAIELMETSLGTRIDALATSTDTRLDAAEASITRIDTQVDTLATTVADLSAAFDVLRQQLMRVTMQAQRGSFAIGELAEITAQVRTFTGEPLDLTNAATRPWIDFLTVWGYLTPAVGFNTVGSAGDRTLSVQVDGTGSARVLLRAEHSATLGDDTEREVSRFMTTRVGGGNQSLSDVIMQAATPRDAGLGSAYGVISAEYDRMDVNHLRNYVDAYYMQTPTFTGGGFVGTQNWRDYRTVVAAFVKRDNDPATADQSLGASSIQVTFRDWLGPWIVVDYLPGRTRVLNDVRDRIRSKIGNNFREAVDGIKEEVDGITRGRGILGKQRDYAAIVDAVDTLVVNNAPEFLNALTKTVKSAVHVQQSVGFSQAAGVGTPDTNIAFEAIADVTTRSDAASAATRDEVSGMVQQQVTQARQDMRAEVRAEQQAFRADLLADSGPIRSVERQMTDVKSTVNQLQTLNPTEINSGITTLNGFERRLRMLETPR